MGAYASVAQLDRASDSDSEGRGFESRQMHQNKTCRSKTDLHVFIIIPFYRKNFPNPLKKTNKCAIIFKRTFVAL